MAMRSTCREMAVALLAVVVAVSGCREPDRPAGLDGSAALVVDSDPRGARIWIDNQSTGRTTPDTIRGVPAGDRDVRVQLDVGSLTYGYRTVIRVSAEDTLLSVGGPLLLGCSIVACLRSVSQYHTVGSTRFAASPLGPLLFREGAGKGLFWPYAAARDTVNSYASMGGAVFAGLVSGTGDTVALGPYDMAPNESGLVRSYLLSRPTPTVERAGADFRLRHTSWVVPPGALLLTHTVRGLAVDYQVHARDDVDGVLVVRLVFRNITSDPYYRFMDPVMPVTGITYSSAYVGFALDGDVGNGDDDLISYVPGLDLAILYDSDFSEPGFAVDWRTRPALLGLRVLERPAGTQVRLNAWPREWDWAAGGPYEREGLAWLSGGAPDPGFPIHPDPRVGYVTETPRDLRLLASAGPLELAPGDSAVLTVAVLIMPPAAGTYTSGTKVSPGDPLDGGRPLLQIAAPLIERAQAVVIP